MPNEITARLRGFLGKGRESHGIHAPFRVTTHRGQTVQTFQSLELALEAALKRISEGTYGTCAKCGEPIEPKRLKALPTAATCISCSV